jgi:hypothetical protein
VKEAESEIKDAAMEELFDVVGTLLCAECLALYKVATSMSEVAAIFQ